MRSLSKTISIVLILAALAGLCPMIVLADSETSFAVDKETPLLLIQLSYDADGDGIDDYTEEQHIPDEAVSDAWYGEMWASARKEDLSSDIFTSDTSLSAYFCEMSLGKLRYVPAKETAGVTGDGILEITLPLPHPEALAHLFLETDRFAGEVGTYPSLASARFAALDYVIRAALAKSDDYVDYASFDVNHDGIITPGECTVVLLHAGYLKDIPSAETDERYPFSIGATTESITYTTKDNVKLDNGGMLNLVSIAEFQRPAQTILPSVLAHEICHSLGARDLYSAEETPEGWPQPCYFSLMHNSVLDLEAGLEGRDTLRSIPYLDPYQRLKLGFFTSMETVTKSGTYTIGSTLSGNYRLLKIATPDANEYFLVEFRENSGFEKNIAASSGGFLVWLIDESINRKYFDQGLSCSYNAEDPYNPGVKLLARGITADGFTYTTEPLDSPYYTVGSTNTVSTFSSLDFASPIGTHAVGYNRSSEIRAEYQLTIKALTKEDGTMEVRIAMPEMCRVSFYVNGSLWKETAVISGNKLPNPGAPDDTEGASWHLYTGGAPVYNFSESVTEDFYLIWTKNIEIPQNNKLANFPQYIYVLLLLCTVILLFGHGALTGKAKKR